MLTRAAVVGAAAIGPFGLGWRGVGESLLDGGADAGWWAGREAVIPDGKDAGDGRQRKLMSRAARLAAIAQREALAEAGWVGAEACADVGAFFGVGASGAGLPELGALVRASLDEDGAFSLERCGQGGLAAVSPLFAFQIMNNFTLCHGAILTGLGGPNAALFSRGAGTTTALSEALWALAGGDCERAIAGGADTALHPVTRAELGREGFLARGLLPGEGAAVLALARTADRPLAWVEGAEVITGHDHDAVGNAVQRLDAGQVDLVITAPWGSPARRLLSAGLADALPSVATVDLTAGMGDSLAAAPALAWISALDLLVAGRARRILVIAAGCDGDVGATLLVAASRGTPPADAGGRQAP